MEITHILLCLVAGTFAGVLNTLAGGGSLITLPILIFLGLPTAMANGTNRLAIFFQNVSAVVSFKRNGISEFKFSILVAIPALVGAIIGSFVAVDLSDAYFKKILSVIMIVVLIVTLTTQKEGRKRSSHIKLWPAMISFFFIGIYGGFIKAGVGFIILAVLSLTTPFDLIKSNAIKVFVVLIYTFFAIGVFVYHNQINWTLGLVLACGNSIGGWLAAWVSNKIGNRPIKTLLVITMLCFSVKLAFFS